MSASLWWASKRRFHRARHTGRDEGPGSWCGSVMERPAIEPVSGSGIGRASRKAERCSFAAAAAEDVAADAAAVEAVEAVVGGVIWASRFEGAFAEEERILAGGCQRARESGPLGRIAAVAASGRAEAPGPSGESTPGAFAALVSAAPAGAVAVPSGAAGVPWRGLVVGKSRWGGSRRWSWREELIARKSNVAELLWWWKSAGGRSSVALRGTEQRFGKSKRNGVFSRATWTA